MSGRHHRSIPLAKKAVALAAGAVVIAGGAIAAIAATAPSDAKSGDLVQATGTYAYTSSASVSKKFANDVHAGDLLTVSASFDAVGSPTATVSDSQGNTWAADTNVHPGAADRALVQFHAVAKTDGADTIKVTFNAAKTQRYISIAEYAVGTAASTPPPTTEPPTTTAPPTTAPPTTQPPSSTPPPSTTPPPSSTPPPVNNAAFPDQTTTGNVGKDTGYEPTGVTLHSCTYTAGVTSYDSCSFSNDITVNTPNVHITRSLIKGQVRSNSTGLVISDTTINCGCGSSSTQTPPAVYGGYFTLTRDNIFNAGHEVQISDSDVTVEDSWLHGNCCSGNQAHADAIISNGGADDVVIRNNNVDGAGAYMSAAMGLFGDFGGWNNWTVDHNLFNTTGSYCLYAGGPSSKQYAGTNMHYTNNHFGKEYSSKCGIYGPVTGNDGTGYVWSGNVWDDGSGPVN